MIAQTLISFWHLTTVEAHDGTKYQLMPHFDALSANEQIPNFHPNLSQTEAP